MSWQQRIQQALIQRRAEDGWRERRVIEENQTRLIRHAGQTFRQLAVS